MKLIHGDCLEKLRELPDCSVDAVVTDPPYGLSFMGKKWDYDVPSVDVWAECLRVLKPGGHLLAFAGTRTQHRMAVRIEDAGFEIRDMIAWVYGSGFPKSHDVSKAIDKAAGAEREVVGQSQYAANRTALKPPIGTFTRTNDDRLITAPATEAARQWSGWGTALKPALEPITVARKPLIGTVADNVMQHGTGAINVDGCRVRTDEIKSKDVDKPKHISNGIYGDYNATKRWNGNGTDNPLGRWPANLIHDGSDEVVGLMNDSARFFYCTKASKADRDEGCEGLEEKVVQHEIGQLASVDGLNELKRRNIHPTVKPTALMRYLVRLVTPPGGTVLDPFMGSGSTGKAAKIEGFDFIGIEREAEYIQIAEARIAAVKPELKQGELF